MNRRDFNSIIIGGLAASVMPRRFVWAQGDVRVNGERIRRAVALRDGDQLEFGSVRMAYRAPKDLPPTVTRSG